MCSTLTPQSPESGASQALWSPLKLPPEGVAITISISPSISILPDITFNADSHQHLPSASPISILPAVSINADGITFDADSVTFGADGCQHLLSASRLPSASPVSISFTVSILFTISTDADGITFDADSVTFGADSCQHLPSASRLPSALMLTVSPLVLMAVSISCQHLAYRQHLTHHLSVLRACVMETTQIMQYWLGFAHPAHLWMPSACSVLYCL